MRETKRSNVSLPRLYRCFFPLRSSPPTFFIIIIISRFFALGWQRRHVADFLWTARFPEYLTFGPVVVSLLTKSGIYRVFYKTGLCACIYIYIKHMLFYIILSMIIIKGWSCKQNERTIWTLSCSDEHWLYDVSVFIDKRIDDKKCRKMFFSIQYLTKHDI